MAQDDIQGQVVDAQGNPVSGAIVELTKSYQSSPTGQEAVQRTTTDSNGNYIFTGHQEGDGTTQEWHVSCYNHDGTAYVNSFNNPGVTADLPSNAIPDSAVAHGVASDYDGSKWVADVGPDIPDNSGNPTQTSVTNNGETFDVVRYDGSNDNSKTGNFAPSTGPNTSNQQFIFSFRLRSVVDDFPQFVDGGAEDEFAVFHRHNFDNNNLQGRSDNAQTPQGPSADNNWHIACLEATTTDDLRLLLDSGGNVVTSTSASDWSSMSGITLGSAGDSTKPSTIDIHEYTILEGGTATERDSEINRQANNVGI